MRAPTVRGARSRPDWRCFTVAAALSLILVPAVARAQDSPVDQVNWRYDEDWSVIKDKDPATLPSWAPVKYQPLSGDGSAWISAGIEGRVRYEGYQDNEWGGAEKPNDSPVWLRVMPHLDLHAGRFRVFAQGIAGTPISMASAPGPADKTGIDLLQGFGEASLPIGDATLTIRGGRELVSLGSERLVGTRYGPNIPQAFDGLHVIVKRGGIRLQLLDIRRVDIGPGTFDDRSSDTRSLKAAYVTFQRGSVGLDAYLLDFANKAAQFEQGRADERRRTWGVRFFGHADRLSWNWEAMLQEGRFGTSRIAAWSLGTETSYKFAPMTFRLRANIVSGDRDKNDDRLGTFDPMFPKGKYFGELSPIGPYNIMNLHPDLEFDLGHGVSVDLVGIAYWRESLGDGVYGIPGNLLRASNGSTARFVGHQEEVVLGWQATTLLSFTASVSALTPGGFIRETGPAKPIHMIGLEAMYRL